jgi:hypothetical protein
MTRKAKRSPNDATHERLTLENVPGPSAEWSTIEKFALTFNGYEVHGSFDACAEIANAQRSASLTDLRTCLFYEQRRWRHFGYDPDASTMEYIHGIVEKIRLKIAAGESE